MAVEGQARLQAQGIPGAQADRADAVIGQQGSPHPGCLGGRQGDLEAVLARIARARDDQVDPAEAGQGGTVHEGHAGDALDLRRQDRRRLGSLQGQEGAVLDPDKAGVAGQLRVQETEVLVLAGPVDHDEQALVVRAGSHQVVEDPARVVEQDGVLLAA